MLPAIAAWLLHAGIWWIVVFVVTTPIMSGISHSVNWFLDEFAGGNGTIVETYWTARYTATQAAEALIPVVLGILVGAWVLRNQKKEALT